jgi:NADH-quinone oxidoreductase subunit C
MIEGLTEFPDLRRVAEVLEDRFGPVLLGQTFEKGEYAVRVAGRDLPGLLSFLKDQLGFATLEDIIGLDVSAAPSGEAKRFSVLYQLARYPGAVRVRLVVDVGDGEAVPSATPVFRSADWAEREIFDLFGILFEGHPDLRRIYLPDDFDGHPLRKDFPLEGK